MQFTVVCAAMLVAINVSIKVLTNLPFHRSYRTHQLLIEHVIPNPISPRYLNVSDVTRKYQNKNQQKKLKLFVHVAIKATRGDFFFFITVTRHPRIHAVPVLKFCATSVAEEDVTLGGCSSLLQP